MTGSERFGANLREWRLRRKLTQETLGEKIGSDGPRVSRLERGEENPTLETIDRLGDALSIDVRFFHEPRPEQDAGHEKVGGAETGLDPVMAGIVTAFQTIVDADDSAPDTIEGDVLKAHAVLTRAVQRIGRANANRNKTSGSDS